MVGKTFVKALAEQTHERNLMRRHWTQITRRLAPVLAAGLLLQTSGCSLDAAALQELFGTIADRVLADFVFGAFNLPAQFAGLGF